MGSEMCIRDRVWTVEPDGTLVVPIPNGGPKNEFRFTIGGVRAGLVGPCSVGFVPRYMFVTKDAASQSLLVRRCPLVARVDFELAVGIVGAVSRFSFVLGVGCADRALSWACKAC